MIKFSPDYILCCFSSPICVHSVLVYPCVHPCSGEQGQYLEDYSEDFISADALKQLADGP